MFNMEVKVDGKYVRGTIKKARKEPQQTQNMRHMSYAEKERLAAEEKAPVPYVFHGNVQKHTGEGQGNWSVQDLMECMEEMEQLRYKMHLMNQEQELKSGRPESSSL